MVQPVLTKDTLYSQTESRQLPCAWHLVPKPTHPFPLYTLQKQAACFNHKVVTLVADKLERLWLGKVCFGVED